MSEKGGPSMAENSAKARVKLMRALQIRCLEGPFSSAQPSFGRTTIIYIGEAWESVHEMRGENNDEV